MRHFASRAFWEAYGRVPEQVRALADKNYALLKENPQHPSKRKLIMTYRISLVALVLITTTWVAAAQAVKIGSTSIILTPPRGQCELSNEKGDEARLIEKFRELLAGRNQLLAAYADCQELADFRSSKQGSFDNFAQYLTPTQALHAVLGADAISKVCASMRTRGDESLSSIVRDRAPDIERIFQGLKMNEVKFLGVLTEEPSICYTAQSQKLTAESGVEKVQVVISASIILKGKFINYQLYARYIGSDTIPSLLVKHKNNVAALIVANSK